MEKQAIREEKEAESEQNPKLELLRRHPKTLKLLLQTYHMRSLLTLRYEELECVMTEYLKQAEGEATAEPSSEAGRAEPAYTAVSSALQKLSLVTPAQTAPPPPPEEISEEQDDEWVVVNLSPKSA